MEYRKAEKSRGKVRYGYEFDDLIMYIHCSSNVENDFLVNVNVTGSAFSPTCTYSRGIYAYIHVYKCLGSGMGTGHLPPRSPGPWFGIQPGHRVLEYYSVVKVRARMCVPARVRGQGCQYSYRKC